MKSKTVNKILSQKFEAWASSIEDPKVQELVRENTIITGGAIVSLLLNEEVHDFDLYFRDLPTTYAVADYYVKRLLKNPPPLFKNSTHKVDISAKIDANAIPPRVRVVVKSAGIAGASQQDSYQYFETFPSDEGALAADEYVEGAITDDTEPEAYVKQVSSLDESPVTCIQGGDKGRGHFRVLFMTSNAITLSDKVQIVIRFYGPVEEIHKNYDFVHCTSSWTSWNRQLILRPEALETILTKELKYVGSLYPVCSLIRLRKFLSRGWTINAGQFVKMAFQISELDLGDPVILEDQLVGVDSAYFRQLISQLRMGSVDPSRVDGTYLMTLIDKIF